MIDKIYIVEYCSWSSSRIEKVFRDRKQAEEYANTLELTKKFSDGYMSYYVREFEVS